MEDLGIPQSQVVRAAKLRDDQGRDGPVRNSQFGAHLLQWNLSG